MHFNTSWGDNLSLTLNDPIQNVILFKPPHYNQSCTQNIFPPSQNDCPTLRNFISQNVCRKNILGYKTLWGRTVVLGWTEYQTRKYYMHNNQLSTKRLTEIEDKFIDHNKTDVLDSFKFQIWSFMGLSLNKDPFSKWQSVTTMQMCLSQFIIVHDWGWNVNIHYTLGFIHASKIPIYIQQITLWWQNNEHFVILKWQCRHGIPVTVIGGPRMWWQLLPAWQSWMGVRGGSVGSTLGWRKKKKGGKEK